MVREGDILYSPLSKAQLHARSISTGDPLQLWPAGIVPYTIDPSVPKQSVVVIKQAIDRWNRDGGVSIIPLVEAQADAGQVIYDSVRFVVGDFCASWVGRQGGQQDLWVASHCSAGSVMHELGHVLGLEHEHTRPDRDQHIRIHWENVQTDKIHNFDLAPAGARMLGDYDLTSIMHYGTHNFSSTGGPTLSPLDPTITGIGQRNALSAGDLEAISTLYGSDLSVITRAVDINNGTQLDIFVTNESARGAVDVSVQVPGVSADMVVSAPSGWSCDEPFRELSVRSLRCTIPLFSGGASALLTLVLPESISPEGINVTLASNTPDLDLSNNASHVQLDDGAGTFTEPALAPVGLEFEKEQLANDEPVYLVIGGGAIDIAFIALYLICSWLSGGIRCCGHRVNSRKASQ